MSPAQLAVRDIYYSAEEKQSIMLLAARSDEERTAIQQEVHRTQLNWNRVQNQAFHDSDPALDSLVTQANAAVDALQHIDEHIGDIAKVLAALTQGVAYGTEIVTRILAV